MAYGSIVFKNPMTGGIKTAPVGFSWTTLFFSFFPALLRGHWVGALVIFLLGCVTFGLSGLIVPFLYNKMYVKYLVGEGFKVKSASHGIDYLRQKLGVELEELPAEK